MNKGYKIEYLGEGVCIFLICLSWVIFINWSLWLVASILLGIFYAAIKSGFRSSADYLINGIKGGK